MPQIRVYKLTLTLVKDKDQEKSGSSCPDNALVCLLHSPSEWRKRSVRGPNPRRTQSNPPNHNH